MILLAVPMIAALWLVGGWPHVLAPLLGCVLGWAAVRWHERKTRGEP